MGLLQRYLDKERERLGNCTWGQWSGRDPGHNSASIRAELERKPLVRDGVPDDGLDPLERKYKNVRIGEQLRR